MTNDKRSLTRREFLAGSAAVAAGMTSSCVHSAPSTPSAGTKRPNILFFFADQLRSQELTCNGGTNIQTPNIDRLMREGVAFTNAISTCPVCTPYRGMLQTGRYPTHTGVVANWINMNPREYSIAEAFAGAGYETGFIGKWHLSASFFSVLGKHLDGLTQEEVIASHIRAQEYQKQNPETEYVPPGEQRQGYQFWAAYNFHMDFNHAFYYRDTPERLIMPRYETDSETDMAIEFMRANAAKPEPFFLMVAPHPPHPPFSRETCPPGSYERVKSPLDWRPNVPENPTEVFADDPRAYYAMIANIDDNIGRLLDFLDESGLSDDTIFVFTSDHGEMLYSHGRRNKMVPYEESVNVPLGIRWPGHVPAGVRTDTLQTPMDHMPTLLALAGLEIPGNLDGRDLSDAVLGKAPVDRDAILMMNYTSHWDYFDSGSLWPEWRGVRTKTHTYVKWLDGKEELYDNVADPYQMTNRVDSQGDSDTLRRLRARLEELLAEAHDDFLPGTAYADWYDDQRNLVRTALGPVG